MVAAGIVDAAGFEFGDAGGERLHLRCCTGGRGSDESVNTPPAQ